MMEARVKIGLKKSKGIGLFLFIGFVIVLAVSWFYADPYNFDGIEIFFIGYVFGCALGVMTGRDIIRSEVKSLFQESKGSEQ